MEPQTYSGGLDYLSRDTTELTEPHEKDDVGLEEFISAVVALRRLLPHANESTSEASFKLINDAVMEVLETRPDLPYTRVVSFVLQRKDLSEAIKLENLIREIRLDPRPDYDSIITKRVSILPDAILAGQFNHGLVGLKYGINEAGSERGVLRSASRRELGIKAVGLSFAAAAASTVGALAAFAPQISGNGLAIAAAGGSSAAVGAAVSRRKLKQTKSETQEAIIAAANEVALYIKEPLSASLPVQILPSAYLDPTIERMAKDIENMRFPIDSNMPESKWNRILQRLTEVSLPYAYVTRGLESDYEHLELLKTIQRQAKGKKSRQIKKELKAERRTIRQRLTEYDPLCAAISEIAERSAIPERLDEVFEGMDDIATIKSETINTVDLDLRSVTLLHILHYLAEDDGKHLFDDELSQKVWKASRARRQIYRDTKAKVRSEKALSLLSSYLDGVFDTGVAYRPEEYDERVLDEVLQLLKSTVDFIDPDIELPDSMHLLVNLMNTHQPRHYGQEKRSKRKK